MKKMLLFIFLLIISVNLFAQNPYQEVWKRTDLFDSGDYDPTRGMVWNPNTDHLLVVTRTDPYPRILILDPETGQDIGVMDTTNLPTDIQTEEGIGQIDIADDGAIYVCDLGDKEQEMALKVWKYDHEGATAQLCFDEIIDSEDSENTKEWYGASLDIIGAGTETYLYTSGWQNRQIAVLKMGSRGWFQVDHFIPLPTINSARHGISVIDPLGNLWINGAGTSDPPARLITNAGDILVEVPADTMIGGAASETIHWSVGNYNIITALHANSVDHTINSIQYEEDELGTINLDYFGGHSDTLNSGNNINATAVMRYDSTRHWLYALDGANVITALDLNPLAKVTTPRDSGLFSIEIDGKKNEYTRYDYMGKDDDRKLYFTWSEEMVYAGISGNTLYAPFQERGLFLAFDTDPDESDGATTLPTEAASIGELPFRADLIVQFDSDDYADLINDDVSMKWTTGKVYQWNDSEWTSSDISGFDINYGAMTIIGDGNDSLITEVGVARNPAALGSDVAKLRLKIFLAEMAPAGEVLAAFPNDNETGNGVSFTSYYEFDDLGNDLVPAKCVETVGVTNAFSEETVIEDFELKQNYPNPFNPETTIEYFLPGDGFVKITIYDILGNKITTLVNKEKKEGHYQVVFDGAQLPSGIYFYQFSVDQNPLQINKMMLIK